MLRSDQGEIRDYISNDLLAQSNKGHITFPDGGNANYLFRNDTEPDATLIVRKGKLLLNNVPIGEYEFNGKSSGILRSNSRRKVARSSGDNSLCLAIAIAIKRSHLDLPERQQRQQLQYISDLESHGSLTVVIEFDDEGGGGKPPPDSPWWVWVALLAVFCVVIQLALALAVVAVPLALLILLSTWLLALNQKVILRNPNVPRLGLNPKLSELNGGWSVFLWSVFVSGALIAALIGPQGPSSSMWLAWLAFGMTLAIAWYFGKRIVRRVSRVKEKDISDESMKPAELDSSAAFLFKYAPVGGLIGSILILGSLAYSFLGPQSAGSNQPRPGAQSENSLAPAVADQSTNSLEEELTRDEGSYDPAWTDVRDFPAMGEEFAFTLRTEETGGATVYIPLDWTNANYADKELFERWTYDSTDETSFLILFKEARVEEDLLVTIRSEEKRFMTDARYQYILVELSAGNDELPGAAVWKFKLQRDEGPWMERTIIYKNSGNYKYSLSLAYPEDGPIGTERMFAEMAKAPANWAN